MTYKPLLEVKRCGPAGAFLGGKCLASVRYRTPAAQRVSRRNQWDPRQHLSDLRPSTDVLRQAVLTRRRAAVCDAERLVAERGGRSPAKCAARRLGDRRGDR